MAGSILALALVALLLISYADGALDDSRAVVPASEILAKIKQGGPVEYDGVIVEGDLNVSGLNLPTEHIKRNDIIESPINITNSQILGNVNFCNAIFQEHVDFENTNFTGDARFSGSGFSNNADFTSAVFSGGDADFSEAKFSGGDADFSEAEFSGGDADFSEAEFSGGDADFSWTVFSGGDADFSWTVFSGGDADFSCTVFSGGDADFLVAKFSGGDADFSEAEFLGGDADFFYAEFWGGDVDFSWTMFSGGDADFLNAEFWGGDADFSDAKFNKNAVFDGAEFKGKTDFDEAVFSGEANFRPYNSFLGVETVYFYDTVGFNRTTFIQKANFEMAQFNGPSYFNTGKFEGEANFKRANFSSDPDFTGAEFGDVVHIRWKHLKGELAYDDETYLLLIENYKNIGWFEDANDCYYQYRKERRAYTEMNAITKIEDSLLAHLYGYGVKPSRSLWSSAAIIVFFGILWFSLNERQQIRINGYWTIPNFARALKFSATVFLSGTKLFVDPPELPQISGRFEPISEPLFIMERVLGSLLFFLFIIAASNTMIR